MRWKTKWNRRQIDWGCVGSGYPVFSTRSTLSTRRMDMKSQDMICQRNCSMSLWPLPAPPSPHHHQKKKKKSLGGVQYGIRLQFKCESECNWISILRLQEKLEAILRVKALSSFRSVGLEKQIWIRFGAREEEERWRWKLQSLRTWHICSSAIVFQVTTPTERMLSYRGSILLSQPYFGVFLYLTL